MDNYIIIKEIMDYCESTKNYSYYELAYYAQNNKPEWEKVLKNKKSRLMIAAYLNDARKEAKRSGNKQPTLIESFEKINADIKKNKGE